jgi:hypothetical protein
MKLSNLIGYILALAVGCLAAFFILFNVVFTDVFSLVDRLSTFLLVVVVYGIIGGAFGFGSLVNAWKWALWINLPAIVIIAWYTTHEPQRWLLHLAYLALSITATAIGTYAASQIRLRSRSGLHRR